MNLKDQDVILFIGDSVTDCNRERAITESLGWGYASMVNDYLNKSYPELTIKVLNRGVSGDTSKNVLNRFNTDCIELKPDWVSILVGVNDTWRKFDHNELTTPEQFEETYRKMIMEINKKLNAKLILCEPFILPNTEDRVFWRKDLDPKIEVIKKLAREFHTIYVPFNDIFKEAMKTYTVSQLAEDGVHPGMFGHRLMAEAWLYEVGL